MMLLPYCPGGCYRGSPLRASAKKKFFWVPGTTFSDLKGSLHHPCQQQQKIIINIHYTNGICAQALGTQFFICSLR